MKKFLLIASIFAATACSNAQTGASTKQAESQSNSQRSKVVEMLDGSKITVSYDLNTGTGDVAHEGEETDQLTNMRLVFETKDTSLTSISLQSTQWITSKFGGEPSGEPSMKLLFAKDLDCKIENELLKCEAELPDAKSGTVNEHGGYSSEYSVEIRLEHVNGGAEFTL